MRGYEYARVPDTGDRITVEEGGGLGVPDRPIIPFIEGDGIGPEIWRATRHVVDASVWKAYDDQRAIQWMEVFAGEKANGLAGDWLPEETFQALRDLKVGIKGPLTTPVGGGIRSLNVTLRKVLDLYSCIRPVRWIEGVPSPMKEPERLDVVIFRENTEDVYAGIEWESGTEEAEEGPAVSGGGDGGGMLGNPAESGSSPSLLLGRSAMWGQRFSMHWIAGGRR